MGRRKLWYGRNFSSYERYHFWYWPWLLSGTTAYNSYTVQFSHSVVSDSFWSHKQQHARLPCPSPTPGVHQNPSPSSQWCHPIMSSSVVPFCSCHQSFPASGSFQMSQFFSSGWPKYWSFSFNISPSNENRGLISFRMSFQSKGFSRVFSNNTVQKHQSFGTQLSL